ncbi:hypothetical protein V3N99_08925 [Dermatophilaceae bacterium Soc4.6]
MTDTQTHLTSTQSRSHRVVVGAGWGVVATLAMSVLMIAGVATGISPMPKPIPEALVAHTLGSMPKPALIGLAVLAHLGYGATAGAVLALVLRRVTVATAIGYAVVLWALMGLVWLPYLGWGPFGTAVTAKIAAATLLLHLVYGTTLGLLLDRGRAR